MSRKSDTTDADQAGQYVQQIPALLLRERDAAKVLAVGERTLWDLAGAGEIPVVYIGGSKRYRLSDLQEWVAKQPTAKPESTGA